MVIFAHVSRDHRIEGKTGRSGNDGIRSASVERLAAPTILARESSSLLLMSDPGLEHALDRDSLRTARYWVPGMAVLLVGEAASHVVPLSVTRVVLSFLSAVVIAGLSWMIWRHPANAAKYRYWLLIAWALPLANIASHIGPGRHLAVVFSTMALLLCGALLTRRTSFAIALPVTAAVQIYSVLEVGDMSAGFLAPLFAIPIAVLLFIGRRRAIIESYKASELEKALRAQSAQLSRYQGLARMSGYVAHHFSNLMTGAVVGSSMALETLGQDHPSRMWVELTKESTDKTTAFTSPLARFAGYSGNAQGEIAADEIVSFPFLRHYVPERIAFACHVEEGLDPVVGNVVELLDCLLAVIDNAVDALEHSEAPSISVYACAGKRGGVEISVKDNGEGIDARSLAVVQEPFYTSRGRARSGLGLTYAKGIVDRHNGDISIESTLGEGTCVTLILPKSERLRLVSNEEHRSS